MLIFWGPKSGPDTSVVGLTTAWSPSLKGPFTLFWQGKEVGKRVGGMRGRRERIKQRDNMERNQLETEI